MLKERLLCITVNSLLEFHAAMRCSQSLEHAAMLEILSS